MPTTQPRISAVVERPLFEAVEALAERDGMSLSQKARDLLRHAVDLEEALALEGLVADRKARSRRGYPLGKVKRRYKVR
jgi:hypothetical protein